MYGDYYYDSVWAAATGIVIVLLLLILALAVLFYVFTGIGLYTMGKRRGVQAPWLAWLIPSFVIGAIADDYDERTKGKAMGLRWILLGLTIGSIVLNNIGLSSISSLYAYGGYGSAYGAGSGIAVLTGTIIGITLLVFSFIALFRLYKSANPNSATTLLVLSIFFSVIIPFVIFGMRKKDDGMPMPYGQQGPMGYTPYGSQPPYYGQNQYQPYQGYQNPAGGFAPQGYQPPMQQNPNAQYPGSAPYQGNPAQQPGAQPAQPQNGAGQGEGPSEQ